MTETISASFMERHFGEESQRVAAALVEAGNETHVRSLDAKTGSRLKTNHAYGSTFWLALPEEVVSSLTAILDGAVPFPPQGAPYEILVWNDLAILPVKVMEASKRDPRLRARISDLRSRLTRVNVPKPPEPTLFDDADGLAVDDFEKHAGKVAEAAQAAIGNIAEKMVVAAYRCSPKSGLQVVRVGIATLDADGYINFSDSEQLSLVQIPAASGKPVEVAGEAFDAAPRPKPILEVVEEDETATAAGATANDTTIAEGQ